MNLNVYGRIDSFKAGLDAAWLCSAWRVTACPGESNEGASNRPFFILFFSQNLRHGFRQFADYLLAIFL